MKTTLILHRFTASGSKEAGAKAAEEGTFARHIFVAEKVCPLDIFRHDGSG
jgi:hypothetical protein